MRDIKFRVWDKCAQQFISACSIYCANGCISNALYVKPLANSTWVLQEYTGLKDVKGIDIYEGDIISGSFYDTEYHHAQNIRAEVVFNAGAFNIASSLWFKPSLKVIGNVFQTPNALK